MKSNLQTIKKGSDSISQYLHRIKEARDCLSAAGVFFADEDIVILALNGLPAEYNTFRCVIRGRESVISLKDFRSQLLAKEVIVDASVHNPLMTAMAANTGSTRGAPFQSQSFSLNHGQSQVNNRGFQSYNGNKNRGRGRFTQGSRFYASRPAFSPLPHVFPNSNSGVLGSSPGQQFQTPPASMLPICQLCNSEDHTAPFCGNSSPQHTKCHICGRRNHSTWYCFYNDKGPNYIGMHTNASYSPRPYYHLSPQNLQYNSSPAPSQHVSVILAQHRATQQPPMQAMHTGLNSASPSSCSSGPSQVWLTDSSATNHMTDDLGNLSLASPYPTNEMIHTANGEGLTVSHIGHSTITSSLSPIKLNYVLCVPQLTQNLLSVHRLCLDNNCWLIFDAFCF
jgi:hypothetical protein